MRVTDIRKIEADTQNSHPVYDKQSDAGQENMFRRQIRNSNEEQHEKYISELQDRIIDQGEIIKKKADIKELQQYRQLITELLDDVVSNSYTCYRSNSFDTRGKHKIFVVIRNINEKLDQLTNEILTEQKDNLKLLETVDEIKGLLVDLFI
ncbi:MAG: YaaR family protein [Eubacteriales bacterium]|nr:YaaR family protein [Eubacteriales bacterium]